MTPAQAMFEALQLSLEVHGLALRRDWPPEGEDRSGWERLADAGLATARNLWRRGERAGGLTSMVASCLADTYWRTTLPKDAPTKEHASREHSNHWTPAAMALLAAAQAERTTFQTAEKEAA